MASIREGSLEISRDEAARVYFTFVSCTKGSYTSIGTSINTNNRDPMRLVV
jgi:hypothetical protein